MKKILLLSVLVIFSCSGGDDSNDNNDNNNSNQTFLERFDGVVWQNDNYDPMNLESVGTVWLVFYNNNDYLVSDIGYEDELRCLNFPNDYFSIVTNDYDNLILSVEDDEGNIGFFYINTLENGERIEWGWSDESYTDTFSVVNIPNPCD